MKNSFLTCFLIGALALGWLPQSLGADDRQAPPSQEELVKMGLKASREEMAWWHDAKFGIFIHWGVGMTRGAPWMNKTDDSYFQGLFENLRKVKKFDAKEWISVVKAGGAKYVIFMTRQNGYMQRRPGGNFCLWDTKTTNNRITHPKSPFKRDVCKEIADAAHAAGIRLMWYHCGVVDDGLKELLTNYGKVSGVWFDGGWAPGKTPEQVYQMMRKWQPGIVTNGGMGGKYGGDYDTPQHAPPWPGWNKRPVEVAAILRNGYWYWDRPNCPVKSLEQVVHLLMRCVGGGNNLALNLAPRPDGRMEPNEVERIKEVGAWLGKYGRSVYNTRKGPFCQAGWGVCTRSKDGNTVYLHMLQNLDGGKLVLPPINKKIVSAEILTSPEGEVKVTQTDEHVAVVVPNEHIDPIDTIIALELDGPAMEARIVPAPSGALTKGKPARASHVWTWPAIGVTMETNGPAAAVDGHFETGWASRAERKQDRGKPRWLEVDLGGPAKVSRCLVSLAGALAAHRKGHQAFEVQVKQADEWLRLFGSGSLTGLDRQRWDHKIEFEPVTGRFFRLLVWGRTAYVREFQLFGS
ncbi:MAG: alpha-L-fucosidase [Planctomycetota bacterium]|jgi:alpha-L-fucosidase